MQNSDEWPWMRVIELEHFYLRERGHMSIVSTLDKG